MKDKNKNIDKQTLFAIFFCVVTGYLFAIQLLNYHNININDCIKATLSPLDGYAWWRAFQNRYLAGWIINGIGSFKVFLILGFIAINISSYYLYNKKLLIVLAQMGALFLLQFSYFTASRTIQSWIYGWDVLDIFMIVLLLIGTKNKLGLRYYSVLFLVFIFNRESALYIPAYLIIVTYFEKEHRIGRFLCAISMLAVGFLIIYKLRDNFISSCQSYIGLDRDGFEYAHGGNITFLLNNIKNLFYTFPPWERVFDVIPFATLCLALTVKRNAIGILIWTIIASIFCFAVIHETRTYLLLVPLFIYNYEEMKR